MVTAATHASRDIHVGSVEQAVRSYAIAVQKRFRFGIKCDNQQDVAWILSEARTIWSSSRARLRMGKSRWIVPSSLAKSSLQHYMIVKAFNLFSSYSL